MTTKYEARRWKGFMLRHLGLRSMTVIVRISLQQQAPRSPCRRMSRLQGTKRDCKICLESLIPPISGMIGDEL